MLWYTHCFLNVETLTTDILIMYMLRTYTMVTTQSDHREGSSGASKKRSIHS